MKVSVSVYCVGFICINKHVSVYCWFYMHNQSSFFCWLLFLCMKFLHLLVYWQYEMLILYLICFSGRQG